jgi:auxin efflux carrier family protein
VLLLFPSESDAIPDQSFNQTKLGALYTVLQTFVLGAHLYSKQTTKRPPTGALLYLFTYRFFLMPVISNGVVYGMRQVVGHLIRKDPMLVGLGMAI